MKKLFTFAAAILASVSLWAQEPAVTLTAATSELTDWNQTYDNVTISVTGASFASKKPCGVTVNENAMSLSSADSHWIEISCENGLSKLIIKGSGNSTGTTDYAAPLCACANAPFDSTVIGILEVHYTGYDKECVENELLLPEGTKSVRLYRRVKVNSDGNLVGAGSNWAPATATGNQTYNVTYLEVYAGASTPSTDPVEAAVISGENACALGGSVELTCTAAKATTYQWYLNGAAIDGAIAKKYTFTPTAAGEFSFTCAASNDYTVTPVVSEAFAVTVTDPAAACGELIKATHTGAKTATVTGVLGGTVDKDTQAGGKLGSNGHYFGIKLAHGNFMPGDLVTVEASKLEGGNAIDVFSDKGTTRLVAESLPIDTIAPAVFTLSATTEWIYIYRLSSATNPSIKSISVTRSCEASDNADLEKVWIQVGEMYQEYEAAEDGLTYNLAVPASVDLAELDVYFTLAHPMANANVTSPVHFTVPEAGQSVSETVAVTAQDGETVKTYTINVSKSAAASTEAHLSSLSVAGYTLVPEFSEDVLEYTITKAYGAENPGTDAITADPKDPTARPHAEALENALKITVTAEDNETQVVYTINIVEAEAEKVLNEIVFSNGYLGYNPVSDPQTNDIYAFYLEGEDAPSVQSCNIKGASWSVENDILTITGEDNTTEEFPLHIEAVTPVAFSADKISFVGTEAWVKAPYGFADGTDNKKQGFLFSKTDSDFSREKAGKTHVEMFLPACDTIVIFAGDPSTERDVKFFINGVQFGDITKLVKAGVTLVVEQNAAFMLTVASAQTGGDGGIGAIRMAKKSDETALEGIEAAGKAVKVVRNGQLYILKGDVLYNALGTIVK